MGEPLVDLGNSSLWQNIYSDTFVASPVTGLANRFLPINITSPVLAESPIIRCLCTSQSAKPYWYKGVDLVVGVTSGLNRIQLVKQVVPLNVYQLVRVPDYSTTYSIKIEVPWWHKDITITIDEFVGSIDDTTEELIRDRADVIEINQLRAETKIDQIVINTTP